MKFKDVDKGIALYNVGVQTQTSVTRIAEIVCEKMGLTGIPFEYTGGRGGWKGDVPVFATPMMMALMEGAAAQCLAQFLEEGKTSVGGNISSSHVSATPVGMEVRAVATITEVDGKKVKFAIEAYDEAGLIGKGEHLRIIVTRDRFVQGAYDKLNK